MTNVLRRPPDASAKLTSAAIKIYLIWLLLPAVQTTGRALTGAAAVALFGVGILLDTEYLQRNWHWLLARTACAAAMPLVLRVFLERGGPNFAGFYVQQAMFWFPLVFAGYARERRDERLWSALRWIVMIAVSITVCTTIGWLIQGMLRGGKVYAYSRSLGFAGGPETEAYLKELMLRNIGGYDFVYAMVAALPLTAIGIQRHTGAKRALFGVLMAAQFVMIVLSQYTYAMLYAAAILFVEGAGWLIRRLSKGRVGMGKSLLLGALPLILVLLLHRPLLMLAVWLCEQLGLVNFAFSFEQLLIALQGGEVAADSRLAYYMTAVEGFGKSPLVGSLFGGEKRLSQHSEVLDFLSGTGLIGTALAGGMIWLMGRGLLRGVRNHPDRAQLCLMAVAVGVTALLGTVFYSRDILAVTAIGALLVLEGDPG